MLVPLGITGYIKSQRRIVIVVVLNNNGITEREAKMKTDLLTRMQYEPCVLMFGKKYRHLSPEVLGYNWNAVVTTSSELELSTILRNDRRFVQDIFAEDNMRANLLNKNNLHVIHLFGECYPETNLEEIEKEDACDFAVEMLARVSSAIKRNGLLLIEDFEEECFTHKELRKALKTLYPEQRQVHIFNCKNKDSYLTSMEEQGVAVIYEESIQEYLNEILIDNDGQDVYTTENDISIFINAEKNGTPTVINKKNLLETDAFAELLSVELINEVKIPKNMYEDYFNMFLKNSVREPQWYGYNYGFNIKRSYENRLYRKVKEGLERTGNPLNKPVVVVGQTGTGKSIALAALAHRIFNEKKYPVIYINNPDIYFFPSSEYKQKGISKKGSPAFNALDALVERLENLGAKAVLIVWDTSSFSTGRSKTLRLYKALLSRGRKVFLVCTAYETNTNLQYNSEDEFDEEIGFDNKFVECKATVEVSSEKEQLKDILMNKCKMPQVEADKLINYYSNNSENFLSLFYQSFAIIRNELSEGVYKEADYNLQELDGIVEDGIETKNVAASIFAEVLKKIEEELIDAGITEKVDTEDEVVHTTVSVYKDLFVKCIAICSKYKLKMPYDFALRILGTYSEKIIRVLTQSTFFVISQDINGNYEISLRTPLEASMYIEAKEMTQFEEIECIIQMLKCVNPSGDYGQQKEVRLCENLIRIIGPNGNVNRFAYRRGYGEIINALKELREERGIWEPILISQEITYIREYIGADDSKPVDERVVALKEAIKIADEVLAKCEYNGISMGTRNAIKVESANSKLLLCNLENSNNPLIYKELRRDLREVIKYDNLDFHAYVTLLKGSIIEYYNEKDNIKKIELLEAMCSLADEIIFDNPDVASNDYFQRKVTEIYSLMDDSSVAQSYIDELVDNGSAAGLYVKARKILKENKVDFKSELSSKMQEDACKAVYALYSDSRYKSVMQESEPCQYMLLNIVWLLNNKKPIYSEGECWITRINESGWRELLNITNNYLLRFCNDTDDVFQPKKNIRYLKALCLAELKMYAESISLLKNIEEDASLGIKRVFTKHMLCESDGTTRKFSGRLGKYDEVRRSGEVFIEEFGKTPIYYHGPHMRTSNLIEGTVFNDIEIGFSNIAPKAFREVGVIDK